uniref:Uncharacterized protein n=1 Tax=Avena sativa TaxID=4498 RepID=A0ACD5WQ32_AVESA
MSPSRPSELKPPLGIFLVVVGGGPLRSGPPLAWPRLYDRIPVPSAHAPPTYHAAGTTDWSDLGDGPIGLIAERVLAYDVADYIRFRAVCSPWRQSSTEPRTHSGLDRRFHPWRWTMLREELVSPTDRSFLNTSTGQCVQVDIPELRDHELLALTPEGLLVLARKPPCTTTTLCMLNPLTRQLIQLPPLSSLVPSELHDDLLPDLDGLSLESHYKAWGSGIANDDDSTVVLCFHHFNMLGLAKPGNDHWTLLDYDDDCIKATPIMFEGRFYCINNSGIMVLEKTDQQSGPPRLELAAKLNNMPFCRMLDSYHLVNICGQLVLVHRQMRRSKDYAWSYNTYRVDLDAGTVLLMVKSLGSALFLGMCCSLSVSPQQGVVVASFSVGMVGRVVLPSCGGSC